MILLIYSNRGAHLIRCVGTLQRVALDQLLFSPVFIAIYFLYNGILERDSEYKKPVLKQLGDGYLPALTANYKVWPAVQCITFSLIPLNFRLMFVNCVAIGWCAYLSNLTYKHTIPLASNVINK